MAATSILGDKTYAKVIDNNLELKSQQGHTVCVHLL